MNDGLKNVRDTLASPENAGGGDVPPKPETFVPKAKNVSSGSPENSGMRSPVVPLGHDNGSYFMIAPSGQLRKMSAECLETGRGIRALFAGMGDDVEAWCRSNFKHLHESWCPKSAGRWIIEKCNAKGVFNPESADVRSIGVWRVGGGFAVAHCGDCVVHPDGQSRPLGDAHSRCVMIGGMPIEPPEFERLPLDAVKKLFHDIESRWGWARKSDPLIWLGWVAAASLGGFPNWRVHIYVHGIRGSGKSSLIEMADALLGDLSGQVFNDATEAGLRQSRNYQARPLLIDEFEPESSSRNASKQDSILAMLRRMSGGSGGRISRGESDHSPVSFRTLGPAYLTSINHIGMEPQDSSRFVFLELKPLSAHDNSHNASLSELIENCRKISSQFRGMMLRKSSRWDKTHCEIAAKARALGADPRQADTAATILTGFDLALFDGDLDDQRLQELEESLQVLISDAAESDEMCEGREALNWLLSSFVTLDQGKRRNVRELLEWAIDPRRAEDDTDYAAVLRRHGFYLLKDRRQIAVRSGKMSPTAKFYSDTKWRNGAHASALKKIAGAIRPNSATRVTPNEQYRVLLLPFGCLGIGATE